MGKIIKGFSWKRQLGITKTKQQVARATGIPTTKQGMERKRNSIIARFFGFK